MFQFPATSRRELHPEHLSTVLVVVGGGPAGVGTAIAAAREGDISGAELLD